MKPFASLVSAFALSAVVTGTVALGAGLLAGVAPFGVARAGETPSSARGGLPGANEPIVVGGVKFDNRAAFVMSGKRCATLEPTAEEIKAMNTSSILNTLEVTTIKGNVSAKAESSSRRIAAPTPRRPGSIIVPVYVHLVGLQSTIDTISDARVAAQIDFMNTGFGGRIPTPAGQIPSAQTTANTAFQFRLMGITRTALAEEDLFVGAFSIEIGGIQYNNVINKVEYDTKASLRQGGPETLNMYLGDLGGGLLGYATFPTSYRSGQVLLVDKDDNLSVGSGRLFDGVVCLGDSMPGGPEPYGLGTTSVHEVGHWLGLFHTFQGGCTLAGDSVSDTPAEAVPYFGPAPNPAPDTCATRRYPGRDPFENFMDYSDDEPLTQFTLQQGLRMDLLSSRLRNL